MDDHQQDEREVPFDRRDEDPETASESPPSDDEHGQDHAEQATDPSGDIASGGGEQPV